jgi:hypothetical protein
VICVLLAIVAALPGGAATSRGTAIAGRRPELAFVPDVGQLGGRARFVAHTAAGAILLAPGEVVLAPRAAAGGPALRVEFEGSNPACSLTGSQPLLTRINYLVGDDARRWHLDVPTYGRVTYRDLYAGIDLDLVGSGGALKGTYTVSPGQDPAAIRWRYAGARSLRLAPSGRLDIELGDGRSISEAAPEAWQETGGRKQPVDVEFAVAEDGSVGFATGRYEPALPLVVDPYLVYSTLIGGSDLDDGRDIAVDATGNVYITGTTRSHDFPAAGAPDATYSGPLTASSFGDAFIAKLNPTGDAVLYMTYLGGSGEDIADAITVDADGNAYVTGMTRSTDFPTVNAVQPAQGGQACSSPPCSDAFVAKLNAAGNALVFSTYLGGDKNEDSGLLDLGNRSTKLGIALDDARDVYVTGVTESDNFPTNSGAFTARSGQADAFLTKLRTDGQAILYSTYVGGSGTEYSGGVAVDAFARAYVAGTTLSADLPVRGGLQAGNHGFADAFVTAFDTTTSGDASFLYSTYLGGSDSDYAMAIAADPSGNTTIAGYTLSLDFPTQNPFQAANASAGKPSPRDAFIARLNAAGNQLLYGTYLGGSDTDVAYGVKINSQGEIFVTGRTFSDDFPVKDAWQSHRGGSSDIFVARLDPGQAGAASLVYGTYLGGVAADYGYGIAVDAANSAYVTGTTSGTSGDSFPIYATIGPNGSSSGVVVAKLDPRLQYWIPVASRVAGAKNSQWRTDLGAENGSGGTSALGLRLVAGSKVYSTSSTVATGSQSILTDIVGQLGFTGNGVIEILSDRPVRLSSRTYNAVPSNATCYASGTFGQNYDVATTQEGLKNGDSAWLTQLVETAAYRTNIVVSNTGRKPASVTISLYDGAGALLTSFQLALAPGEVKVDNQPFLKRANKSNLQRAYARIWVNSGVGVVASASVVDNLTNDPTTVAMVPTGSESLDVWVPVSSHVGGANNSQWRTGLGVLNPSTLTANVTLRFRAGGTVVANSTQVAPGAQSILDDVIGAIPATGTGSLEVTADRGVIVTSRTYNLIAGNATCFPKGTLGQSYPSFDTTAGMAAGDTAWLVQLTETAAYRTNISLTNTGATAASVTITLFGATGTTLASYTVSLAAGEMKQDNRPFFSRAGKSNIAAGFARVVINSGAGVVVLASVVDNITNDPTTISPLQ